MTDQEQDPRTDSFLELEGVHLQVKKTLTPMIGAGDQGDQQEAVPEADTKTNLLMRQLLKLTSLSDLASQHELESIHPLNQQS